MQVKTILFPIHMKQSENEIVEALNLCHKLDAHLSVLLFGQTPPVPLVSDAVVLSENWGVLTEDAKINLGKRVKQLEMLTVETGVSADVRGVLINDALMGDAVAEQALYSDLVMITRSFLSGPEFAEKIAAAMLLTSGKPILVGESHQLPAINATKVIIAWDGEKPSSRSISEAIPILKNADEVEILLVDPIATEQEDGEAPGLDLGTYLSRHGIKLTVNVVASGGKPIADVIKDRAQYMGAELIVMGGFGHSRFRQKLFGGTTTRMMTDCEFPMLMTH